MTISVPFLDLKAQHQALRDELQETIAAVMGEAQFILGPGVERFEESFARYLGVKHCVGLNNGTSALHLALLALDIGPGDEVITTAHTWISTAWAIAYVGARPVFVDIDPQSYNLDSDQVEKAITPRTRAILPVHLYGQSAELGPLLSLADKHGLALIEDAAQAHGAMYNGRRVGSLGRLSCFSFYPGKNLGACGEAGAVVTEDNVLAQRVRRLRDHAQAGRHCHVEIGFNMRMEGMQGAVLDVKLRHLDRWNAARVALAQRYHTLLADIPGLVLPRTGAADRHVWHLFVVLAEQRDKLREDLGRRGVTTAVHYPTLVPFQPAFAQLGYRPGAFPVAEQVARTCLSLPMYPELSAERLAWTVQCIKEILAGRDDAGSSRAA